MRIAAAMGMTVAGADAHAAKLQHGNGERGIDIAGAAAADLGLAGLRKQAIDPQIVVEPDAHQHARVLQAQRRPAAWADSPRHPCSAGTRLTAATRSPPTASVRLRKSVVVVTTWMRSCANPGDAKANQAAMRAKRNTMD